MIGKLSGVVAGVYGNTVLLDVECANGCSVGYEILMKTNDIVFLQQCNRVSIFIKEIINEDSDVFYGFLSFEDKCWFEELIKMSGLGPKTALTILSTYTCEAITEAIMSNNCDFFVAISGIGAKIANRIPTEMNKQIAKINEKVLTFYQNSNADNITKQSINKSKNILKTQQKGLLETTISDQNTNKTNQKIHKKNTEKINIQTNKKQIIAEAVDALVALGFAKQNVYNEVFAITKNNENFSTEEIIKEFLKKK